MEIIFEKWLFAYYQISKRYFILAALAFIIFYILFKKTLLKRKIQQRFPQNRDYYRDIFYSLITMGIFAMISVFTFLVVRPYTNLYDNMNDYSTAYYTFTFVWMFFLHDAYFYFAHRLMHHPKLFRWVHLTHHQSNNPSPWTAYAFHPIEAIIEVAIIPIFAFSIPIHRSAIITYMIFQIAYNVYGHLGFEIFPPNFHKHWLGKWINTSVAHNMHHKYSTQNYGLWTLIWDRMLGTLHTQYDLMYQNTTSKEQ